MEADPGEEGPRLTLRTEVDGGLARVIAVGEVDLATAERFGQELTAALDREVATVVVDLAGVNLLDSTGIAALIQARNQATAGGRRLSVVNPQPMVRRVLEVTGVLGGLTGDA